MTKNESSNTIWQEKRLAPLEYCSLNRAAKLLGCDEDDLLHWHDIGSITLAVELPEVIPVTISYGTIENAFKDRKEDKESFRQLINSIGLGASRINLPVGNIEIKNIDTGHGFDCDISGCFIHGVWGLFFERTLSCDFDKIEDLYTVAFSPVKTTHREIPGMMMAYAVDGIGIEIARSSLRVTRQDMEIIHTHALSGQPMPSYINSQIEKPLRNQEKSMRITSKQARAFVASLRGHGLNNTDFSGEISTLRRKLSDIPVHLDTDIDDKTIIDWLKRADVR